MSDSHFRRTQEDHKARILAAQQKVLEANQRTSKASIEVGKEKVQFFEKIALGVGATIAAIISFVASSAAGIRAPNLLKCLLVMLVIALVAAMYRNWRYPFYSMSVWIRTEAAAKQRAEHCEYEMFADCPEIQIVEDGKPISHEAWNSEYLKRKEAIEKILENAVKRESRIFLEIQIVENASLLLIVLAIVLLVALIWMNVGVMPPHKL
jgi:hypothetical protein